MLIILIMLIACNFKEAVDRLASLKQKDTQLENLQSENVRLRELEANFEDVQVTGVHIELKFTMEFSVLSL